MHHKVGIRYKNSQKATQRGDLPIVSLTERNIFNDVDINSLTKLFWLYVNILTSQQPPWLGFQ